MSYEKNRAGLTPAYSVPTYKITTTAAHDFIQKKLNAAVTISRKQAASKGQDPDAIKDINLTMVTTKPVKNASFSLFLVLLPESVKLGKRSNNEMSYFDPDNGHSSFVRLRPDAYAIFKQYMFNEKEAKLFTTGKYREMLGGISVSTATSLAKHMKPRLDPLGISRSAKCKKMVGFFIDPVKVFQDMLSETGSSGTPKLKIESTKKLREDNFEYTVKIVSSSKENKNYMEDLTSAVAIALNSPHRMRKYND